MFSPAAGELVGDHLLGERHLDPLEQALEDGVASRGGLLEALAPAEPLADVGLELLGGVELAGELGELVVELGQLLLLDLRDGDRHLDLLADEVAADQLGGEGLLLALGHAGEGVVQSVEHAALADLVAHAGDLGTLDDLAVLGGLEVDHDDVAVGGRAVDVEQGGEPLTQCLDLLLDVGVGQLDVVDLGLDTGVVGQRDRGLDLDLGGELEGLVVLEPGHLDLGLGDRLEGVLLERLDVLLRQHGVDGLVEDRAATDLAVDDRRRDLAPAEAGDVDLLGDLLVRRVEARLELLEGHLDGQLGPGRAQGLDGALHRLSPWFSRVGCWLSRVGCARGGPGPGDSSPSPSRGPPSSLLARRRALKSAGPPGGRRGRRPGRGGRGDRTRTCGLLLPKQAR